MIGIIGIAMALAGLIGMAIGLMRLKDMEASHANRHH